MYALAQVMYLGGPFKTCRGDSDCERPDSLYEASLQHVDKLFLKFGDEQRLMPMHRWAGLQNVLLTTFCGAQ
jgi:hypothetical protein